MANSFFVLRCNDSLIRSLHRAATVIVWPVLCSLPRPRPGKTKRSLSLFTDAVFSGADSMR